MSSGNLSLPLPAAGFIHFSASGGVGGSSSLQFDSINGWVGIGGAPTGGPLALRGTVTGTAYGFNSVLVFNPTADTIGQLIGGLARAEKDGAFNVNSQGVIGLLGQAQNKGSGTVTTAIGCVGRVLNTGTGPINFGLGLLAETPLISGSATIGTARGLQINTQTVPGVTTGYGIYCQGADDYNYFAGRVGCGIGTPTAKLHLAAGSAAATTAPLKFTTGALMTTPEAGAVEFLTDKLYTTITTGAARKEVTLNDAALSTECVPVATSTGRLTNTSLRYGVTSSNFLCGNPTNVLDFISATFCAILGGTNNTIGGELDASIIVGGVDNEIDGVVGETSSIILGGIGNHIQGASNCTIIGGRDNYLDPGADGTTVIGRDNTSVSPGYALIIGNGNTNPVSTFKDIFIGNQNKGLKIPFSTGNVEVVGGSLTAGAVTATSLTSPTGVDGTSWFINANGTFQFGSNDSIGRFRVGVDNTLRFGEGVFSVDSSGNVDAAGNFSLGGHVTGPLQVVNGDTSATLSSFVDGFIEYPFLDWSGNSASGGVIQGPVHVLGDTATPGAEPWIGLMNADGTPLASMSIDTSGSLSLVSTDTITLSGSTTVIGTLTATGGYTGAPLVTESTTSRTLQLSDTGKYILCTNASAVTITVPQQSSVAWPVGTEIMIEQNGTGQVTVAAGSGATVNTSSTLKSRARYSVIGLKRVSTDVWTLTGDTE
ncbi:MAG TPA: hypothetical protein VEH04_16805 [Verrucomicrobiae bacterium]|nr:hypothetical protein [Verrucomicrobiae bacterium]